MSQPVFTYKYSDPPAILVNVGTPDEPQVILYGLADAAAFAQAYPDRAGDMDKLAACAIPARSVVAARAQKLTALAAQRWEREVGGIVVGGLTIRTDRESQAQLTGAYTSLRHGLIPSTEWKGEDGWVTVTLPELEPVAMAVAQHVADCFAAERAHAAAIAGLANVAQIDAYDIEVGWPGEEG